MKNSEHGLSREDKIKIIEQALNRRGYTPREDAEWVMLMLELNGILPLTKETYKLTEAWVTEKDTLSKNRWMK